MGTVSVKMKRATGAGSREYPSKDRPEGPTRPTIRVAQGLWSKP